MTISHTPQPLAANRDAEVRKFLTLRLGDEIYGLPIMRVREIIGLVPITALPQTPAFVKGVMNLRGRIIPVVDLRARFALPEIAATHESCIVIVDGIDGDRSLTGIVVDAVREVQDIAPSAITPPPDLGVARERMIEGVGRVKNEVVLLLDPDGLLDFGNDSARQAA